MAVMTVLKGMAMGAADVIPGVSGGTIAFITGIYTKLVDEITAVFTPPTSFSDVPSYFTKIDYTFLLSLIGGIATAILLLAQVMTYLIQVARGLVYAFFTGLILASAVYICKGVSMEDAWDNVVMGGLTGVVITGIEVAAPETSLLYLFVSGALAVTAMILPGISGAFILVVLQQYEHVLASIEQLRWVKLGVFGVGALTGLAVFSHPLRYWLHHDRDRALAFLTGLLLGSLKALLPRTYIAPSTAAAGLFGIGLVYALHRYE